MGTDPACRCEYYAAGAPLMDQRILESVNELYRSQPTEHSYSVYDDNAIFHDPVGLAEGIGRIREQ